ncbi:MAG: serine protease, partial [Planctomycetota bacterium]|nr:serine protease [Planctomycetota bacterium]
FILSAAQGDQKAIKARDGLNKLITSEQIAEAQKLAREFKPVKNEQKANPDLSIQQRFKIDSPLSGGTGFIISADGFIVTAYHVVKDSQTIKTFTIAGLKKAILIKTDKSNDLALLKIEGQFKPVAIKTTSSVKTGDEVFTIGFPNVQVQGFEPKFTKGYIGSLTGAQDDPRCFQMSTPVQPGNSGGPLFDNNGNVIGVVVAKLSDIGSLIDTGNIPQNVNYAIKSSYLLSLLETLPDVYRNLKNPVQKKPDQPDIVEELKNSVCLIMCY